MAAITAAELRVVSVKNQQKTFDAAPHKMV